MYLEYFGFQEEPFNITPNSKFLFLSQRHREALAALLYGIEQRKGFIALTGHIGCGKTTICRAMLGKLDRSKTRLALVLNPEFNDVELLQTINGEFGLDAKSTSKRELLDTLNRFLLNEYKNDRNVVLLIDEAQRLPPDALEQVRLISNLETETAKLIQIALVGQPELADLLDLPELEQLNQRITVRYHIEPLSLDEVAEYVNHRIAIARRLNINNPVELVRFTKKALRKVYEYSGGVPRRVNVVSDRSLLVTFVREQKEVSEENVEKAIEELGGMPKRRRKSAPAHIRAAEDEFAESEQRIDGEIPVADSTEEDVPAPVAAATSDRRALNVLIILVVMGVVGYGLTKLAY
ncbi:MAG TPA: AAA family ATPase, partial [Candidatus Sumerlaeota bacterium]|nr:AAA family ATPase [Candidatus Sumerlaeota bacterium]